MIDVNVKTNLSNYSSEIMELVDRYCTTYLFGNTVTYDKDEKLYGIKYNGSLLVYKTRIQESSK